MEINSEEEKQDRTLMELKLALRRNINDIDITLARLRKQERKDSSSKVELQNKGIKVE